MLACGSKAAPAPNPESPRTGAAMEGDFKETDSDMEVEATVSGVENLSVRDEERAEESNEMHEEMHDEMRDVVAESKDGWVPSGERMTVVPDSPCPGGQVPPGGVKAGVIIGITPHAACSLVREDLVRAVAELVEIGVDPAKVTEEVKCIGARGAICGIAVLGGNPLDIPDASTPTAGSVIFLTGRFARYAVTVRPVAGNNLTRYYPDPLVGASGLPFEDDCEAEVWASLEEGGERALCVLPVTMNVVLRDSIAEVQDQCSEEAFARWHVLHIRLLQTMWHTRTSPGRRELAGKIVNRLQSFQMEDELLRQRDFLSWATSRCLVVCVLSEMLEMEFKVHARAFIRETSLAFVLVLVSLLGAHGETLRAYLEECARVEHGTHL